MTTNLTALGGDLNSYFKNGEEPNFLDLGYGKGEDGGVVTFLTISELLYEEWEKVYNDRWEDKNEFKLENVTQPGVYRDDEIYENGGETCYTIVVEFDFLSPLLLQDKIEKLNEKYGTDFEIVFEEENEEGVPLK